MPPASVSTVPLPTVQAFLCTTAGRTCVQQAITNRVIEGGRVATAQDALANPRETIVVSERARAFIEKLRDRLGEPPDAAMEALYNGAALFSSPEQLLAARYEHLQKAFGCESDPVCMFKLDQASLSSMIACGLKGMNAAFLDLHGGWIFIAPDCVAPHALVFQELSTVFGMQLFENIKPAPVVLRAWRDSDVLRIVTLDPSRYLPKAFRRNNADVIGALVGLFGEHVISSDDEDASTPSIDIAVDPGSVESLTSVAPDAVTPEPELAVDTTVSASANLIVGDPYGFHGRVCLELCELAKRAEFKDTKLFLEPGEGRPERITVSGRSMLRLQISGIKSGERLSFTAEGPQATAMLAVLTELDYGAGRIFAAESEQPIVADLTVLPHHIDSIDLNVTPPQEAIERLYRACTNAPEKPLAGYIDPEARTIVFSAFVHVWHPHLQDWIQSHPAGNANNAPSTLIEVSFVANKRGDLVIHFKPEEHRASFIALFGADLVQPYKASFSPYMALSRLPV